MSIIFVSLTFFDTLWGIYSTPKESKKTAVFLSKNNKSQTCSLNLFVIEIYDTDTQSFIFGKHH